MLTDNLVAWWDLDTRLTDLVGGLTLINESADGLTHYVAGIRGQGWEGVASGLRGLYLADISSINPAGPSTISCWLRVTDTTSTFGRAVVALTNGTEYLQIQYVPSSKQAWVRCFVGGANATAYQVLISGWYSLVAVFDPGAAPKLYVNGVAGGTVSGTCGTFNRADGWGSFGGFKTGRTAWQTRYMAADLDDVGIWRRALTEGDALALYNAGAGWGPSVQTIATRVLCGPAGVDRVLSSSVVA